MRKKIAVLASGTKNGGGSGFEKLFDATKRGSLEAKIVCVLSNHPNGGVREKADRLGVRFAHFAGPWTAERCHQLIGEEVDLICMSGWLKLIKGLDPRRTINIHPGPLAEDFAGQGMHGMIVHETVMLAYQHGQISESAVSMHFVTDKYDDGPCFLNHPIAIMPDDTAESLAQRVNEAEHRLQWLFTQYVLEGRIYWDGEDPTSLVMV